MRNVEPYNSGLTGESYEKYDPGWNFDYSLPLSLSGTISLNQFNPAWGMLNSVTLDLSSVFNYGTQFDNMSPTSGSLVTKNIDQRLIIGSPSLLDTDLYNYNINWSVDKRDGPKDYAGASGFTASDSSPVTNAKIMLYSAAMNSYKGTGTLTIDVFSNAFFIGGFTGGNGSFKNTQEFVTKAKVIYDYTPVPIPAAVWFLGTGLVGLFGIRRRFVS